MGAVDAGRALVEDNFIIVGTVDGFRAEGDLTASTHAANGSKNVVVTLALIEFGAFEGREIIFITDDDGSGIEDGFAVGAHLVEDERARPGYGVNEVRGSIVIPKGAGVFEPSLGDDGNDRVPRAFGFCGGGHEDAFLGGGEIDVKATIMIADGGGPCSFSIAIAILEIVLGTDIEAGKDVTDDGPIDEVG